MASPKKGIASILLEKSATLGEIGAGIQPGPNAFHAFDYLGVGEAARGMAVYVDQMRLMDALTAEEITHVDLGDAFRSRFGNPYAVVHRGDLHGVFLKACRDHALIDLRVGSNACRPIPVELCDSCHTPGESLATGNLWLRISLAAP